MKLFLLPFFTLFFLSPTYCGLNKCNANSYIPESIEKSAARGVINAYEKELHRLSDVPKFHWILRMARNQNEQKYYPYIYQDILRVNNTVGHLVDMIDNKMRIDDYGDTNYRHWTESNLPRKSARAKSISENREYFFIAKLITAYSRLDEYNLRDIRHERIANTLRNVQYERFATDPKMIRLWAAPLANQVHWLNQMEIADYRKEFFEAFKKTYPEEIDDSLSTREFNNKIYGLTHIIIAASEYYQKTVDEEEFEWIFSYYRRNIETIIRRVKKDVLLEVAINFLLTGNQNDPIVKRIKTIIVEAIDPNTGILLSETGSSDLDKGEHRNILTVMLLDWKGVREFPKVGLNFLPSGDLPSNLVYKKIRSNN